MENSSVDQDADCTSLTDIRNISPRVPRGSNAGFSLLELLLVLFIMGLMTATTMLMTGGTEEQSKYNETKRRLELVKHAIVGDASRTVNGGPEISGFVADMGRLPGCLKELLVMEDCATTALPTWQQDQTSGIWAGWRGPYLDALPEQDGPAFRDGWGNPDVTGSEANDGWNLTTPVTTFFRISSYGSDGATGTGTGVYEVDYPAAGVNLVSQNDYQAHLQNWDDITVQFDNQGASAVSIAANALRLKLSYPDAGSVNGWPATAAVRNTTVYLSTTFPATAMAIPSASAAGSVAVVAADTVTVPAGSSLAGNNLTFTIAGNVTFPAGSVAVAVTDTVTVPAGSSLAGNSLTFTNAGNMTFPAGKIFSLNTGLNGAANMPVNMGGYSLVVACEDAANPAAVSGKRYDGDCTRYGTDAAPIAYEPVNTPYIFKLAPRAQPLSPPSPLIWDIE